VRYMPITCYFSITCYSHLQYWYWKQAAQASLFSTTRSIVDQVVEELWL